MRAYQFLNEYDRNKTATPLKQQILDNFSKHDGAKSGWMALNGFTDENGQLNQDRVLNYIMTHIEAGDPTPNKIYTPWLTREYAKGNIKRLEDIHSRYTNWLADHFKYKNKRDFPGQLKDIMRLNAIQFVNGITNYEPPAEELKNKGESTVLYDGSTARVIVPQDEAAACYYGQGTKWCTAATKGKNYFEYYNNSGPLYIILPKDQKYDGEKYQLHFDDEQFMDEQDDPIDIMWFLKDRFPELKDFFFKVEPQLKDAVAFADDELLEKLMNIMVQPVKEQIYEHISNMESEDDYYRGWQEEKARELGYLLNNDGTPFEGDPDDLDEFDAKNLEVDWDRVYNDDDLNNYASYNDDAYTLSRDAKRLDDISASEIKDVANKLKDDGDGIVHISELEDVLAKIIQYEIDSNWDTSTIPSVSFKPNSPVQPKGVIGSVGDYIVSSHRK
jgi:hypothetical protein